MPKFLIQGTELTIQGTYGWSLDYLRKTLILRHFPDFDKRLKWCKPFSNHQFAAFCLRRKPQVEVEIRVAPNWLQLLKTLGRFHRRHALMQFVSRYVLDVSTERPAGTVVVQHVRNAVAIKLIGGFAL
jgi:hypothetical protein